MFLYMHSKTLPKSFLLHKYLPGVQLVFIKKKQSVLLIFLSPLDPKISRRWPALAAYESRDSRYTC